MPALYLVVAYLVAQRVAEVAVSNRNHRQLLANGGIEFGREHYPFMVALHIAWVSALLLAVPPQAPPNQPLLALFIVLQLVRVWVMLTLGSLWTTRVILLPGARRVRSGPYRFLKHPAYVNVSLELAVAPLMFGAWPVAVAATALNLVVMRLRIPVENRALEEVYGD